MCPGWRRIFSARNILSLSGQSEKILLQPGQGSFLIITVIVKSAAKPQGVYTKISQASINTLFDES
jgi:hypothetical protein